MNVWNIFDTVLKNDKKIGRKIPFFLFCVFIWL